MENNRTTHWLIISEWITIMGTLVACFVFLNGQIQQQSCRTDKLYEMFIDLLKEGRK